MTGHSLGQLTLRPDGSRRSWSRWVDGLRDKSPPAIEGERGSRTGCVRLPTVARANEREHPPLPAGQCKAWSPRVRGAALAWFAQNVRARRDRACSKSKWPGKRHQAWELAQM